MSDAFIALFLGAGCAAFAYSRLGRSVGYGNTANVWLLVGVVFLFVFFFILILLKYIIHLQ